MPNAPPMPAAPAMPSATMPSATMPGVTMPGAPMAGAPTVDQPPRALKIVVKDESGRPRNVAVSPTRNAPGSRLPAAYMEEFGLGFIPHQGYFHRRLPDHFMPAAAP
jgi:hypothetical protein